MTTGKKIALTRRTFVGNVMSLLFNTLSRFVIAFLPRSKHLLISWLWSPYAMILQPNKRKCHCFHFFLIYLPWSDGTGCHNLGFLNVEFQASFSTLLFHPFKRLFSSSLLSAIRVVSCISKLVNISSSSLYSHLWFIRPGISCGILCIKLNKKGDNIQPIDIYIL